MTETAPATSVLFVCLGNICRSPTAHGVFLKLLSELQPAATLRVDSCGTGDWHIGHSPDSRAQQAARQQGYELAELRARQLQAEDFQDFEHILAMDKQNLADIESWPGAAGRRANTALFLAFAFEALEPDDRPFLQAQFAVARDCHFEVPDPYYGGDDGFSMVLQLVEAASELLLRRLCR